MQILLSFIEIHRNELSACKLRASDLKRIEKILLNIESDNQKFLKDCHYKD